MPLNIKKSHLIPVAIISALFFIFGFVTWLNGILIPYLKIACELTDFQVLWVTFAFYMSYTVMALPSAWVLKKTGLKNGMMVGLFIMALGTALFIPAAYSRTFGLFLTGLFVMGAGLALLQTASNPYVTILGPIESAARRISILGICNKLAGAIAPLILAYYILNDGDVLIQNLQMMGSDEKIATLNQLALRVVGPYSVMTMVLLFMGFGIRLSPLPDLKTEEEENNTTIVSQHSSIVGFPHLILGAIALFFYVGVEVIAGDTIIRYGQSLGIQLDMAKTFTSATMVLMTLGYILGILATPKYISQAGILLVSALLGIAFSIAIVISRGASSVIFVALLGLANAMIWPAIWPLAINGLGKFTNTGSALLIMAISGGAILPLIWGKLSDVLNPQMAYFILLPAYLFILFYALRGHKLKYWQKNKFLENSKL